MHLGVAVALKVRLERAEGEWSELLEAHDSDIVGSALFTLVLEIVVDLTTAEKDLAYLIIAGAFWVLISDNMLPAKADIEVFDRGISTTVLKEFLGDSDDKRLTEGPPDLTPEQMEELSGSSALSKGEVHPLSDLAVFNIIRRVLIVAIAELEEAFNAA